MKIIVIPPHDRFTQAEVAELLGHPRSTVAWWLDHGKLKWSIDYREHKVILRPDLIEFIRSYLDQEIPGSPR